MATIPPNAVHLPFLREAPHLLHLVSNLRTTDVAHAVAQVSVSSMSTRYVSDSALVCAGEKRRYLPGCEDHDICFELRPIRELESFLGEALDGAPVLELNIAIDDVFAGASIYREM